VTLYYTLQRISNYVSGQKIEVGGLRVKPDMIYAGSQANFHVDFQTKSDVYLRDIAVTIYAQERVGSAFSTNPASVVIDHRITHEKTFLKPFDELLTAGRWVTFDCALPVAADAPPSFVSENNVLEWFVKVRLDFKGWPDWVESIPITILP
jgi:hypothetical protein